jgi:hypothetical protein
VEAHAEHQEDDAQLRELLDRLGMSDEAGCERSDHHPDQQVPHERGQPQAAGEQPPEQRGGQGHHDVHEQSQIVHADRENSPARSGTYGAG